MNQGSGLWCCRIMSLQPAFRRSPLVDFQSPRRIVPDSVHLDMQSDALSQNPLKPGP